MKIFFAILLLTFSFNGFSQTRSIVFIDQPTVKLKSPNPSSVNTQLEKFKNSRSTESEWVCYIDQVNATNGNLLNDDALMPIFPDSTIILGLTTAGDTVHVWNHAGGTMIDPTFMPDGWLNGSSHYILDSIAFMYAYERHTDNTIVDTIHLELIKSIDAQLYSFTSGNQEEYQDILFDTVNFVTRPSNIISSWDIPLTEADSSLANGTQIGIKTIVIPTPYSGFAAKARIGAMITFKPGYTWNISDSLAGKNSFTLLSSEENGDNTAPTYLGDHNCSYILPDDIRYNMDTLNWNGYYMPTWIWSNGFDWEHHYIFFKLTSNNVGINEAANVGGALNVYPNPIVENAAINYSIDQSSLVNFTLTNVTGQEVLKTSTGFQSAGNHNLNIDFSSVADGIYSITMETSIGKSIQKVVVTH